MIDIAKAMSNGALGIVIKKNIRYIIDLKRVVENDIKKDNAVFEKEGHCDWLLEFYLRRLRCNFRLLCENAKEFTYFFSFP
jgi:hypothetical protein